MTAYSLTHPHSSPAPLRHVAARYAGAAPSAAAAASPGRWTTSALLTSARRRPDRLARYATRVQSPLVRDALALAATGGTDRADALEARVLEGEDVVGLWPGTEPAAWSAVALAWAARTDGSGLAAAADLYARLARTADLRGLSPAHHTVALQSQYLSGRRERVGPLLERYIAAPELVRGFLALDLERPAAWDARVPADPGIERSWGEHLGRLVFGHHRDVAVGVGPDLRDVAPFDRLAARGHAAGSVSGDLVTVIVPSYRPEAAGMLLAVRSMTEQTWGDLEILVVDDASGPEHDALYAEVEAMDPRVRVVRMPENSGSYVGRNAAMRLARGAAITFQDSDDWSHPRRIEDQMRALEQAPEIGASRSDALRARDDLSHQWLGYLPVRPNASSLMLRRRAVEVLGDFLPIRRGADSEYAERVRAAGGEIVDTRTVLAITRLRSGSLSRGDFSFQWTTPQRLAFKGLFRSWHARAGAAAGAPGLRVDGAAADLPFPVPAAFDVRPRERRFDLVVMADLSLPVEAVLEPVTEPGQRRPPSDCLTLDPAREGVRARVLRDALAAARAGAAVAVWHVEAPNRRQGRTEMSPDWFDLVTAGPLTAAVSGNEAVHTRRLLVADPRHLAVSPGEEVRVRAEGVEVCVPAAPDDLTDTLACDVDAMVVDDALAQARRHFGAAASLVPVGSADGRDEPLLERGGQHVDEGPRDV